MRSIGSPEAPRRLARSPLAPRRGLPPVLHFAGLRLDFATFAELYADIFTPQPAMIKQQQLLAAAGVPNYLCSNCSALHIEHCAARHPFFASFTGLVLSYEAGAAPRWHSAPARRLLPGVPLRRKPSGRPTPFAPAGAQLQTGARNV